MDQAEGLRAKVARMRAAGSQQPAPVRTIAVTSGKGGVGKTNVVVNLAVAMARMGRQVLVIDADLGLANVDVVLGLNPEFTIRDVIEGRKSMQEVLVEGPSGIKILPAASGVSELATLSREEKLLLLEELEAAPISPDVVLIDTAAGITDTVLYFNAAAAERIVIATGEPTSLTDAYALMKVLYTSYQERNFALLVNNVAGEAQAKEVYRKLATAVDYFLEGISVDYLGFLPTDPSVHEAVMRQRPVVEAFPSAPVSRAITNLAKRLLRQPLSAPSGNIKFFWRRLAAVP